MINLTLQSGATVPLSLAYCWQNRLRKERPAEYKRLNAAIKQMHDGDMMLCWADIVYAGYLCGAIAEGKFAETMSYDTFLESIPDDWTHIMSLAQELLSPKKQTASAELSSEQ